MSSNPSIGDDRDALGSSSDDALSDSHHHAFGGGARAYVLDGIYTRAPGGEQLDRVGYWVGVRARARELIADAVPGRDYALTEVVHCKSRDEVGVVAAADERARRHLGRVLALSPAPVVIVVGRVVVVRVVNCKVHIAVDVETHMVLAATVTDNYVHDVTQFATLLGMIPRRFSIAEVYADKGYYSIENYRLVEDQYGAVPFIDFKDSAKPVGDGPHDRALERYRAKHEAQDDSKPRAAVECVNSMFLRTQKPFVRAKLAQQRECEVLAMMDYHNICRSVVLHRTAGLEIPYADERAMAVIRGEEDEGAPPSVAS